MNSRLVRLLRRLAIDSGTSLDDLIASAKALLTQNPKLSPEQIDKLLRSTK